MGNKRWKKSKQQPRNKQLDAVSPQVNPAQQDDNTKESGLQLPPDTKPSIKHKRETNHCKPDQTPWWKILIEGLMLAAVISAAITYGRQLGQMLRANDLAQKTFEVSQQASVTLGNKDGVVAEFRKSGNAKVKDGLVIYFLNSGHMPAKLKWGVNQWFVENPTILLPDATKFEPMKRTRNKKTGAIADNSSTDGSIGGDSVREVGIGYLPIGFADYLEKTNRPFKLNGTYEYCDELGRYACRDFSLEYQHLPYGTFRIIWDNVCIERSWLGNTEIRPDEEVLPMCVPRNTPAYP